MLNEALKYLRNGFSIIPVRADKKPLVTWEPYQKRRASEQEVRGWFTRWPDARIGIVTGSISGVVVIDIDNLSKEDIDNLIPEDLVIPTALTPSGGMHLFFKAPTTPLPNNARVVPGCDFRGEGGYVVASPSPGYEWLPDRSIFDVPLPDLPQKYIAFITNSFIREREVKSPTPPDLNRPHLTSSDLKYFTEGRRDEDLFRVANCLIRSGMAEAMARQVIDSLAKNCLPHFSDAEAQIKIDSALKRASLRERNLTEEVREFVLTSTGPFLTSEIYFRLQLTSRQEKKDVVNVLLRMKEIGLIERTGNRNGCYRLIEKECEEIDLVGADENNLVKIYYPFQIEKWAQTMPKNIVIISGEPNAGKTAFLLNLVHMNKDRFKIRYFSSEMGALELKKRLAPLGLPPSEWKGIFMERASNFSDVISGNDVNIIDFLEIGDEFYRVAVLIKEIYDKLDNGIAILGLQKNPGTDYGLGGMRGAEKARIYLALSHGEVKIVKAKNWATEVNPNGLSLRFKLINGIKFVTQEDWKRG